jgi:hypothetical protein
MEYLYFRALAVTHMELGQVSLSQLQGRDDHPSWQWRRTPSETYSLFSLILMI